MDHEARRIGRYVLYDRIASGGMAQVHLGRLVGAVGFSRTVAIKRLLPHCATDAEIVPMFVDEARLAARIRHPNVVGTLDVVQDGDELLLVMEYVHGESLARLLGRARARGEAAPPAVAVAIGISVLEGLHAAHEARSERGEPLGIVHRDVSPQNVIVGADGVARVVDFGIAKARGRIQTTRDGALKGKAGYVAPEQLLGGELDRRVDVYASAVVLWEAVAGRRLFEGDGAPAVMRSVLEQRVEPPSRFASPRIPRPLDEVIMRGLSRDPLDRFRTAREMAVALERALAPASAREIERWVLALAGDVLDQRAALVASVENESARAFSDARAGERTYAATSLAFGRERALDPIAERVDVRRGKPSDDLATAPISETPSPLVEVPPPAAKRRSRVPLLALGVVAVVALVGLAVTRSISMPVAASEVTSTATSTAPAPVLSESPPVPPAPVSVGPSATLQVQVPAPAVPAPTFAAKASPRHVPQPSKSTQRPKADAKSANCQVPFTRAPDGTKIPKPECF